VSGELDPRGLAVQLARAVRGEVRFSAGGRALYATDASNYRQVPIGVVVPRDGDDIVAAVSICAEHGVPILPRGGGTALAGQTCNAAVVLDCSRHLDEIVALDPQRRTARVQPGVVLDDLRAAAERHGLTFGPDPATHDHCTLGGMIGNNSCGVHSMMSGRTVENVDELEVLLYDGTRLRVGAAGDETELDGVVAAGGRRGEIYGALRALRDRYGDLVRERYPDIPRRVSGYNLDELLPERGFHVARALVGSEGTCVTVLEATLRLVPSPPARCTLALGFADGAAAAEPVPEILKHGPTGVEGFDDVLLEQVRKKGLRFADTDRLPDGGGWLLVEFGGSEMAEATDKARELMDALKKREGGTPSMRLLEGDEAAPVWSIRESGLGGTARVPGEPPTWAGWEDAAVPPQRLAEYLRDFRKLCDRHGYRCALYGHYGQGCVHTRIDFELTTAAGIANWRSFLEQGADLVVAYGGSLSGEHGDGQARAELLPRMFGPELVQAFSEFKAIWDPAGKMNPGKVSDPAPLDANLRLGTGYRPAQPKTHFAFAADEGSLANATLRCVGVGKCRRHEGGTMCPSYMVTREEQHSTRGRAHLLHEMLAGDVLNGGWGEEAVKEALDLCLACKGCKAECPVNVDMATYKAEFLSHYYAGRLRPRSAYALGLIYWWARLARRAPRLVNAITHAPLLAGAAKASAGVARQREIPRFAPRTFKQDFFAGGGSPASAADGRSGGPGGGRPEVILWADTFNDHFHPATAHAAVEVLEAAGYHVHVPATSLCCGRPLYDWDMLRLAKRLLRQTLAELGPQIRAGVPLVGLEPSCLAVFRDELCDLLPADEDAKRLRAQSFTLAELLAHHTPEWEPPRLDRRALHHGHCHHEAIMHTNADQELLKRIGIDLERPEAGCCGMAGAFGFEANHYDVAVAAGERKLLPDIRATPADTLILADGFSCREQIRQGTDRHALHLAELLQLALHTDTNGDRA